MTYSLYDVVENGVLGVGLAGMLLVQVLVLNELAPQVVAEHSSVIRIAAWAFATYAALPNLRPAGELLLDRATNAVEPYLNGGNA